MSITITMTQNPRTITLYQGDDRARLDELKAEVDRLAAAMSSEAGSQLASEQGDYAAAVDAHNAFRLEAMERAVKVVCKPLGRKEWRRLIEAHPPRPDHPEDTQAGVNETTFADPLVEACLIEPAFESDAAREVFLDSLTPAQFESVYLNAFLANRDFGDLPKELPSSLPSRSSSAT